MHGKTAPNGWPVFLLTWGSSAAAGATHKFGASFPQNELQYIQHN
jgi:hypothetical protein